MEQKLSELHKQLEKYIDENIFSDNLKKKLIYQFKRLSHFMEMKLIVVYDKNVGEEYLKFRDIPGNSRSNKKDNFRYDARYIGLLNGMLEGKWIIKKKTQNFETLFPDNSLGFYVKNFLISYVNERRLSSTTKRYYYGSLQKFCEKALEDKIYRPEDITSEYILQFMSLQSYKDHPATVLRSLLSDLYSKKIINFRTANILANYKARSGRKLPSYYTLDEIVCIEKSVDRKYAIGKRDYAMILLATRLGLRSSDIRLLQFSNINWETNLILMEQFKTKKMIELPLLTDVGEAIIDYIRHSRPKSISKYIFLRASAPYLPLGGTALNAIFKKYFIKSNVEFAKKRHGPHSMRHSLATNLLKNGTALPIISEALGHCNTASTMPYVHLDSQELLKCSLDVPMVCNNFYIQKGKGLL
ncbi:hypothetical protein EG339_06605 [Chryseobacterium bernardetii]|uniref:Integrase n=1 Tax=Chryseobacterium bernardetii TaxID=1241978 RepID=A0A3G6T4M1_9FLAO|nr:site-specific integrase [Chryseobacterium bernardetii]AZB24302.1 hypothetical protein EG339_06605 [Chryseobacterium bernardetii]